MRKLVVNEHVTVDGVTQAPGLPDEDLTGGLSTAAGTCRTSTRAS